MENLYHTYTYDRIPFGVNWCGPEMIGLNAKVAHYAIAGEGGRAVDVYCSATPLRTYRIQVLAVENVEGEILPGYVLRTGPGAGELAAKISKAIAEGVLELSPAGAF